MVRYVSEVNIDGDVSVSILGIGKSWNYTAFKKEHPYRICSANRPQTDAAVVEVVFISAFAVN